VIRYLPATVLGTLWLAAVAVSSAPAATLLAFEEPDLFATANTVTPSGETASGFETVRPGALTELVFDHEGVRMTIKRQNDAPFDIVNNNLPTQTGKSPEFGDRSLDPFVDQSPNGFVINFTSAPAIGDGDVGVATLADGDQKESIAAISVLMGDFGKDFDALQMAAYDGLNGTGSMVGAVAHNLPKRNDHRWTQARFDLLDADGFSSIVIVGGLHDFDVFLDRIWFTRNPTLAPPIDLDAPGTVGSQTSVVFVPEPAAAALCGLGAMAGLLRRPRRRAA
jgi:hypothetical protein